MNDPETNQEAGEVQVDPLDQEDPREPDHVLPFDEWVERVQKAFQMAQAGVDIPEPTDAWREAYDAGTSAPDYFASLTN